MVALPVSFQDYCYIQEKKTTSTALSFPQFYIDVQTSHDNHGYTQLIDTQVKH